MVIACFIPIRSGSKRIKNKNFVKINKEPLIKHICKKIINSKLVNKFYIGSEDYKTYSKIGHQMKNFAFFKRSKKSATSMAPSEMVLQEFLKENENIDIVVFVQATNPFIKYEYIDNAIEKLIKGKYDSLLSVVKSKHFLWKNKTITSPINYNYKKRAMSQSINSYYVENGSFYIFYKKNFLKYKNRLHGKIGAYEMPLESVHEIDEEKDLRIVKKLLKK
tara:strand:- start:2590 stop:3249 length:660 start_codon:yes stop_codon:yes gene_type:complete